MIPSEVNFESYKAMLMEGLDDIRTQIQIAEELGVTTVTIQRWNKKIDWEAIKAERRKKYHAKMIQVDQAMFKTAIKGDVAAAKLIYERWDGYTPTSALETKHSIDEADIDAELKNLMDRKMNTIEALQEGKNEQV